MVKPTKDPATKEIKFSKGSQRNFHRTTSLSLSRGKDAPVNLTATAVKMFKNNMMAEMAYPISNEYSKCPKSARSLSAVSQKSPTAIQIGQRLNNIILPHIRYIVLVYTI